MGDRVEFAIKMLALAVIVYMLISILYLYVAVGENWNLILDALFDGRVHGAILISISSALIVGVLSITSSVPVAYLLTYTKFRGRDLLETLLIDAPQTFPPVTEGLVYLLLFGRFGLAYTFAAVIIAKFYVSAPFTISFAARRFREIKDSGIDIIARSLGAKTSHILSRILLPLSAKDLVAGFSLTWARAMGELAATLVFAGAIPWVTETLPALIYLTSSERPQMAVAASVIMETLCIISLLIFKIISRRGE